PVVATVGMAIFSYKLENITDWRLTIYYLQDGIVGFVNALFGKGPRHLVANTAQLAVSDELAIAKANG
ncbi:hypothetical protein QN367_19800, partial [Cryobacterium sp. RTS3]|uniref:hypothetical protein n=1 Tax=Cryobacterium sp. RTS3 TaxID=3048643 RepID=UPI002B23712C